MFLFTDGNPPMGTLPFIIRTGKRDQADIVNGKWKKKKILCRFYQNKTLFKQLWRNIFPCIKFPALGSGCTLLRRNGRSLPEKLSTENIFNSDTSAYSPSEEPETVTAVVPCLCSVGNLGNTKNIKSMYVFQNTNYWME